MNGKFFLFIALLLAPMYCTAQGYADLASDADGFAIPSRDDQLVFPKDDGSHPDFRIEWWYLTANLKDVSGNDFGVQWTLFRRAMTPDGGEGLGDPNVWMAHAALTSKRAHFSAEKFGRSGTGQAGVIATPFEAWIDDWSLVEANNGFDVRAGGDGFSYDLHLFDHFGRVAHGQGGYSVKSPDGQASHYYSRPFLSVTGDIEFEGRTRSVTGSAWLDREWSSQPLSPGQDGWDWAGLTLEDGRRLMVARVRGDGEDYHFGSLVRADGSVVMLGDADISMEPLVADDAPTRWKIDVVSEGIDATITALNGDAWTGELFTYWEGPVVVSGSVSGVGYLEMTGYQ